MTLLETPRSRFIIGYASIVVMVSLGLLFAHQITGAQAAKRAVMAEDALVMGPGEPRPDRAPVLVELFTSEGCSSCPPADALLGRLLKDQPVPTADIIVLEEHVDYWDSLGWHDRFSSHQLTERQTAYAQRFRLDDPYTPQMVVDGADQFTGNDSALRAIAQAAHKPKLTLMLSPLTHEIDDRINVSISSSSATNLPKADLYAALIETMASTQVLYGENGGHTLNHVSVVRTMQKIGTSNELANPLFFSFAVPKDVTLSKVRVVVFAQTSDQGTVIGAVSSSTPPTDASSPE
jgi:hypothetical protein